MTLSASGTTNRYRSYTRMTQAALQDPDTEHHDIIQA